MSRKGLRNEIEDPMTALLLFTMGHERKNWWITGALYPVLKSFTTLIIVLVMKVIMRLHKIIQNITPKKVSTKNNKIYHLIPIQMVWNI